MSLYTNPILAARAIGSLDGALVSIAMSAESAADVLPEEMLRERLREIATVARAAHVVALTCEVKAEVTP